MGRKINKHTIRRVEEVLSELWGEILIGSRKSPTDTDKLRKYAEVIGVVMALAHECGIPLKFPWEITLEESEEEYKEEEGGEE